MIFLEISPFHKKSVWGGVTFNKLNSIIFLFSHSFWKCINNSHSIKSCFQTIWMEDYCDMRSADFLYNHRFSIKHGTKLLIFNNSQRPVINEKIIQISENN